MQIPCRRSSSRLCPLCTTSRPGALSSFFEMQFHTSLKVIILPRQARDKRKENSKKRRFLQVHVGGGEFPRRAGCGHGGGVRAARRGEARRRVQVQKTQCFVSHVLNAETDEHLIYQDGLGTNIGEIETKRRFVAASRTSAASAGHTRAATRPTRATTYTTGARTC